MTLEILNDKDIAAPTVLFEPNIFPNKLSPAPNSSIKGLYTGSLQISKNGFNIESNINLTFVTMFWKSLVLSSLYLIGFPLSFHSVAIFKFAISCTVSAILEIALAIRPIVKLMNIDLIAILDQSIESSSNNSVIVPVKLSKNVPIELASTLFAFMKFAVLTIILKGKPIANNTAESIPALRINSGRFTLFFPNPKAFPSDVPPTIPNLS